MQFFIVCPGGLEGVLASELEGLVKRPEIKALGITQIDPAPANMTGGIGVNGPLAVAMAINLHSRIASRVLLKMADGPYKSEDDLFRLAKSIGWEDWFSSHQTLRVDLTAQRSPLKSLNFATLRIKDAIVDRLREQTGERPNIDTANPDVRVQAHLTNNQASIYLDTSGEPLFKRGWREEKGEAPLKENLAAGILALTPWQSNQALYDPMCGSGTFLIEAAQTALHIPPGAIRAHLLKEKNPSISTVASAWKQSVEISGFGFTRLKPFHTSLEKKNWAGLCDISKKEMADFADLPIAISGGDINEKMITICKANWQRAYLPGLPVVRQVDAIAIKPTSDYGVMVFNPPYGERLGIKGGDQDKIYLLGDDKSYMQKRRTSREPLVKEPIDPQFAVFLDQFSKQLKDYFGGWQIYALTADMGLPGHLRMKESKRTPLFNGPLECRLFKFDIRKRD